TGDTGSVLLLVYWALNLPFLGQEIALIARQYPGIRNSMLRLLEPLGAPAEATAPPVIEVPGVGGSAAPVSSEPAGVSIVFERATVRLAGRDVLHEVSLSLPAGSHVAIVGRSG